jgi:flagellar basal body-associated protein FliL
MEPHLREKRRITVWVALAVLLGTLLISIFGSTLSVVQTSRTLSNTGTVKGIGVGIYWNSACTNTTSSINWGILDPGSNKTVTVYVRNEGNSAATLSRATQNWNPSTASSYMTLTWNYAGQTLSVNQVLQIRLTLAVSSAVSGITSFSFDIVITATG